MNYMFGARLQNAARGGDSLSGLANPRALEKEVFPQKILHFDDKAAFLSANGWSQSWDQSYSRTYIELPNTLSYTDLGRKCPSCSRLNFFGTYNPSARWATYWSPKYSPSSSTYYNNVGTQCGNCGTTLVGTNETNILWDDYDHAAAEATLKGYIDTILSGQIGGGNTRIWKDALWVDGFVLRVNVAPSSPRVRPDPRYFINTMNQHILSYCQAAGKTFGIICDGDPAVQSTTYDYVPKFFSGGTQCYSFLITELGPLTTGKDISVMKRNWLRWRSNKTAYLGAYAPSVPIYVMSSIYNGADITAGSSWAVDTADAYPANSKADKQILRIFGEALYSLRYCDISDANIVPPTNMTTASFAPDPNGWFIDGTYQLGNTLSGGGDWDSTTNDCRNDENSQGVGFTWDFKKFAQTVISRTTLTGKLGIQARTGNRLGDSLPGLNNPVLNDSDWTDYRLISASGAIDYVASHYSNGYPVLDTVPSLLLVTAKPGSTAIDYGRKCPRCGVANFFTATYPTDQTIRERIMTEAGITDMNKFYRYYGGSNCGTAGCGALVASTTYNPNILWDFDLATHMNGYMNDATTGILTILANSSYGSNTIRNHLNVVGIVVDARWTWTGQSAFPGNRTLDSGKIWLKEFLKGLWRKDSDVRDYTMAFNNLAFGVMTDPSPSISDTTYYTRIWNDVDNDGDQFCDFYMPCLDVQSQSRDYNSFIKLFARWRSASHHSAGTPTPASAAGPRSIIVPVMTTYDGVNSTNIDSWMVGADANGKNTKDITYDWYIKLASMTYNENAAWANESPIKVHPPTGYTESSRIPFPQGYVLNGTHQCGTPVNTTTNPPDWDSCGCDDRNDSMVSHGSPAVQHATWIDRAQALSSMLAQYMRGEVTL